MFEDKTRAVFVNMLYTINTQKKALNAYKKLGSASYFKRLRDEEIARYRRKARIKRNLKIAFCWIRRAFILWAVLSLLDILFKFATPNPIYLPWNLFILLF
jgi:hypothetical protein